MKSTYTQNIPFPLIGFLSLFIPQKDNPHSSTRTQTTLFPYPFPLPYQFQSPFSFVLFTRKLIIRTPLSPFPFPLGLYFPLQSLWVPTHSVTRTQNTPFHVSLSLLIFYSQSLFFSFLFPMDTPHTKPTILRSPLSHHYFFPYTFKLMIFFIPYGHSHRRHPILKTHRPLFPFPLQVTFNISLFVPYGYSHIQNTPFHPLHIITLSLFFSLFNSKKPP